MKNHLNRLKKCDRTLDSFKFEEDKLYELSLIKNVFNDDKKKFKCEKCFVTYSTNGNLKRHMNEYCKGVDSKNVVVNNNSNITNNIVNNITNNNTNNTNNNTNNINIVQFINPFNISSKWSTDHINVNEQYDILMKTKLLYSNTLEKILENDENLNLLIDKNNGIVYNNDDLEKMELDKLYRLVIGKLNTVLCNFKNEVEKSDIDKNISLIEDEINIANKLFFDYKNNKDDIRLRAKNMINDIYNNKRERTQENLNKILNKSPDDDISKKNYF